MTRPAPLMLVTLLAAAGGAVGAEIHEASPTGDDTNIAEVLAGLGTIEPRLTILYDNYVFEDGTEADWGFSCLIEGGERTILFDTGTRPAILAANAARLGVDLSRVQVVVISHEHGDHMGGLPEVLRRAPSASVYLPASLPHGMLAPVEALAGEVFLAPEPRRIMTGVALTGELGSEIREQSLLLNTPRGVVVVAGCSHPGIEIIAARSRQLIDRPIALVLGGFHMGSQSPERVQTAIHRLRELGVEAAAPTHCTGEEAIALFRQAYGERFIQAGVGRRLEFGGDGTSETAAAGE